MRNPSICKFCDKTITVKIKKGKALISHLKRKKFCNSSCAAKFNKPAKKNILCQICNINEVPRMSGKSIRKVLACFECVKKDFR